MKHHLIFGNSIIILFHVNHIEPDLQNKTIKVGTNGYTYTEEFETEESLIERLYELADITGVDEKDLNTLLNDLKNAKIETEEKSVE